MYVNIREKVGVGGRVTSLVSGSSTFVCCWGGLMKYTGWTYININMVVWGKVTVIFILY